MSGIDVDDLLIDPDTGGDSFSVIRRPESVSQFGRSVVAEHVIRDQFGSVYPSSTNSLVRDEAYSTGMKSMTVVTAFRLRSASKEAAQSYQPDLVIWGGDRYIVREVRDFSRYGGGFVEADCIQQAFAGEPPQITPPAIGKTDFQDAAQSGLIGAI